MLSWGSKSRPSRRKWSSSSWSLNRLWPRRTTGWSPRYRLTISGTVLSTMESWSLRHFSSRQRLRSSRWSSLRISGARARRSTFQDPSWGTTRRIRSLQLAFLRHKRATASLASQSSTTWCSETKIHSMGLSTNLKWWLEKILQSIWWAILMRASVVHISSQILYSQERSR